MMETNNLALCYKPVFRPKCQTRPFSLPPYNMHEVLIAEGLLHFLLARGLFL